MPPVSGAFVMSTGILAVGFATVRRNGLSGASLLLAGIAWVALGLLFLVRFAVDRHGWLVAARRPAGLTAVAAPTVIAARLAMLGWTSVAYVLLVLSAGLWLVLLPAVLGQWTRPAAGAAFMTCVATQGLVIDVAVLVRGETMRWLMVPLSLLFLIGLVLYVLTARDFDWAELLRGRGDHWVLGGALSISALAAAEMVLTGRTTGFASAVLTGFRVVDLVAWSLALLACIVLACCELGRPRPRYDARRWATVFPIGMTAVATAAVARAEPIPQVRGLATVLVWAAALVWLLVGLAGLACLSRRARRYPARFVPKASASRR
jgi:hypothetical protein